MQVKVLKNMIHQGTTHFVGAIIHVKDELVAELEGKGFIDSNVTQNPATLTPQEPAKTQEEVKSEQVAQPQAEQPAQTSEEKKADETASHTESSEEPAKTQEPSDAPKA